jgi:hypothetical protein
MRYLIFFRMAHISILVALLSKVYVSGRFIAGSNLTQGTDVLFLRSLYVAYVASAIGWSLVQRNPTARLCVCLISCHLGTQQLGGLG